MRRLNLDELEIFQAVATSGGITAASRLLHRVPSNITTRLKQLETRLGVSLFDRCDNRLVLTAEGRLLLGYAERLFQLASEAEASLLERRPMGVLRIGSLESTAGVRLPSILSDFNTLYPEVRLEIRTDTTGGLVDAVIDCEVEGALISQPFWAPGLSSVPIFEEELVLISEAGQECDVEPDYLRNVTLICFPMGCSYRKVIEGWLANQGVTPKHYLELASYPAIIGCVAAGTGVAIVPVSVVESVGLHTGVRCHELPPALARNVTHFVWRPDRESVTLRAFRALLQQYATQSAAAVVGRHDPNRKGRENATDGSTIDTVPVEKTDKPSTRH